MSGNPFRASLVQKTPTTAPLTSFTLADSTSREDEARNDVEGDSDFDTSALPAKTKKTVRIEAATETIPPHAAFHNASDPPSPQTRRSYHADAPQSRPSATFAVTSDDNDVYTIGREGQGMTGSSWKTTGGSQENKKSPSGAPVGLFSRTLAEIEPEERGNGGSAGQSRERTTTDRPVSSFVRQSLDVEGFKNLLMQGISSPRSSGPPPQNVPAPNPPSAPPVESGSSTDTSSVSRQSIFEPVHEQPTESPRTSYEMAASDDERVSLMGETKKEKKVPPPAPRHRHGKLVSARTPQTVSFSDFSVTEPAASPPLPKRADSDLNKPLPPTPPVVSPPAHIVSQHSNSDISATVADTTKDSETASISDAVPMPKKIPPPVPLARRQSQLRSSTRNNRSRSNSSLTMSSQHSTELPPISSESVLEPTSNPSSFKAAPPPPPPTRRHGAPLSSISTSSANSSSTELSASLTPRRPTVSSPNPPSSRRTTISSDPPSPGDLARSPSTHNNRSVSNESGSMPPPPPPPRRRQSGRSSLDRERPGISLSPSGETRRISIEYKRTSIDGKRPVSISSASSLKHGYFPTPDNEQALYSPREEPGELAALALEDAKDARKESESASNILEDMEKFQREIDELREKYKQAA